jgi:hypothetical protein
VSVASVSRVATLRKIGIRAILIVAIDFSGILFQGIAVRAFVGVTMTLFDATLIKILQPACLVGT